MKEIFDKIIEIIVSIIIIIIIIIVINEFDDLMDNYHSYGRSQLERIEKFLLKEKK